MTVVLLNDSFLAGSFAIIRDSGTKASLNPVLLRLHRNYSPPISGPQCGSIPYMLGWSGSEMVGGTGHYLNSLAELGGGVLDLLRAYRSQLPGHLARRRRPLQSVL